MPSPWSIKGIPQEARAAAKAAAQRQGMTLGAWLVSKIEEEAGAPRAEAPAPAPLAVSPAAPAPISAPMNEAALQALAQMMGRQDAAPAESAAIASLSARIDALSEIAHSLSNTVAQSLKTIEECALSSRATEEVARLAAENAEAARREAATSLRASAAVAEKAVAALGGVEAGEDIREDVRKAIEAKVDQRLDLIESRIRAAEEDGANQLDDLTAAVARTEAMLEELNNRAPEPPAVFEVPVATMEGFADPVDLPETGELRKIEARSLEVDVAPIEATQLRERIRNRLKAGDIIGTDLHDADVDAPAARPDGDHSPASPAAEAAEMGEQAGVFGLGGWFRRRPAASDPLAQEDDARINFDEVFPETNRAAEREQPSETSADAAMGAAHATPAAAPGPQPSEDDVFDLAAPSAGDDEAQAIAAAPFEDERIEASSALAEPSADDGFDDDFDEIEEDDFRDAPRNDGGARAPWDDEDDSLSGGFDAAIERARRERERFKEHEEAEAERMRRDPLRRDAPAERPGEPDLYGADAPLDEEPLALGSPEAPTASSPQPRRAPAPAPHWDDGPIGAADFEFASPPPSMEPGGKPSGNMAESVGRQGADRSRVSSEVWPYEADFGLDEAGERALRDENGSMRYGVAMSLALMALTAGAAMAALYQLGA